VHDVALTLLLSQRFMHNTANHPSSCPTSLPTGGERDNLDLCRLDGINQHHYYRFPSHYFPGLEGFPSASPSTLSLPHSLISQNVRSQFLGRRGGKALAANPAELESQQRSSKHLQARRHLLPGKPLPYQAQILEFTLTFQPSRAHNPFSQADNFNSTVDITNMASTITSNKHMADTSNTVSKAMDSIPNMLRADNKVTGSSLAPTISNREHSSNKTSRGRSLLLPNDPPPAITVRHKHPAHHHPLRHPHPRPHQPQMLVTRMRRQRPRF